MKKFLVLVAVIAVATMIYCCTDEPMLLLERMDKIKKLLHGGCERKRQP